MLFSDKKQGRFKRVITSTVFLIVSFLLLVRISGQEQFQIAILDRIQWSDGRLSGDNRSNAYLDDLFENIMNTDRKWIGTEYKAEYSEGGASGFKLYIVEHGLIGVILVVLAFISAIGLKNIRINHQTGFIVLCLLLLYQNSYPSAMSILLSVACVRYIFEGRTQKEVSIANE
jgi:hypothetical protein